MRSLLPVLLLLLLPLTGFAETYSSIRLPLPSEDQWKTLQRLGIPLEEGVRSSMKGIDLIVNSHELKLLREAGFSPTVIQADMEAYYRSRPSLEAVNDFAVGSMGGNFTYDETINLLKSFRQNYPNLISSPLTIGNSIEGRAIVAVKISDNPDQDETDEQEVLYTGLTHAREPESLMCVLYFMERLLKGYGKDRAITYLVNHRQLWFVPVVNPDGYVYNQKTNPGGGGLWRKNRRKNANGTYGVDLNRNYGFQWGYNDFGSSPDPASDIYRGTSAFSEPETRTIRDFVEGRRFVLTMNFHSYLNKLIHPWSYTPSNPTKDFVFEQICPKLTEVTGYPFGNVFSMLKYTANGEAGDWFYGDVSHKPSVVGLTTEIGSFFDGFWPPRQQILGLAKLNYSSNLSLAWMAGSFPVVRKQKWTELEGNGDLSVQPGEKFLVSLNVQNLGLKESTPDVTLTVTSKGSYFKIENLPANYGDLKPLTNRTRKTFSIEIAPNAPAPRTFRLTLLIYSNGSFFRKDHLDISVAPH